MLQSKEMKNSDADVDRKNIDDYKNDNQSSQNSTWLSSLYSVLFVISSALIGFTAARNSLTW